jgi:beta-lactamase regulating signal transducer with metallopeptidase domain/dipeptidyl aminopeptidase/acylaminoacyl peptidase
MEALAGYLQPFFQWLWQTTVIASLVICLILAAQKLLGNRLGPRWSQALWLVLLLRMVVPWAPPSRISLLNLLPSSVRQAQLLPMSNLTGQGADFHSLVVSEAVKGTKEQPATPSQSVQKATPPRPQILAQAERPPEPAFPTFRQALPLLWWAGATLIGAYLFVNNFALWRIVKRERPSVNQSLLELFEECKAQMGVQTLVAVVPSSRIRTPALFGFVRPRLLLPHEMIETANRDQMRFVFLHELAHLKRHDIYLGWLMSLLQVLHWFNPLVWLAFHRMRSDRELACDALVLARTGQQESQEYGRAIVALLRCLSRSRPLPAMAGILESKSQLKRRIAMIARFTNNSYRWSPLAVALIVVLCCVSLPDAKSGKAAEPSAARPTGASASGEQPAATPAGDSNVFVDPQTGIKFHKARTFSGPNDVIEYSTGLNMSPNGRFLLWDVKVIPLDGSKPFDLVNMPNAGRGSWSPNGKFVAFYAGAIWLLPVDPETGHPTGPPDKLLEGDYWYQESVRWSPDSERVIFSRRDKEFTGGLWTLAVRDRSLAKVTDPSSVGKRSADGKYTAFTDKGVFWVKTAAGEEAKKIGELGRFVAEAPILWSADDEWLLCSITGAPEGWPAELRFFRLADSHEVKVSLPAKMGSFVAVSADQKKLFFYRHSYEEKDALRVVSVSGGPSFELGRQMSYVDPYSQFWSPDSESIVAEGNLKSDDYGLWALPLSGDPPIALKTDISGLGKIWERQLSPDFRHLLVSVERDDKTADLWAAPVSWKEMRTTGPAVLIFKNWDLIPGGGSQTPGIWSPDGTRIAIMQQKKGEIWIVSAEGGEPVQLTDGPGWKGWPVWSPDGKMIALYTYSATDKVVQIVSASGGKAKTVATAPSGPYAFGRSGQVTWSPDGKTLTIAGAGVISSISISDGSSQPLVNLKDIGKDTASGLWWSPDGRNLAFNAQKGRASAQLFLFRGQDGHITKILDEAEYYFFGSPDGKWISYKIEQRFKSRPEGILWEMDVEEALAKLAK